MTAEEEGALLAQVGELLWPDRPTAAMSELLGIHPFNIRRWNAGKRPIPGDVWGQLYEVLETHEAAVERLRRRVLAQIREGAR